MDPLLPLRCRSRPPAALLALRVPLPPHCVWDRARQVPLRCSGFSLLCLKALLLLLHRDARRWC